MLTSNPKWNPVLLWKKSVYCLRRGVVVITTVQLHSAKSELRFCAGLVPARGVSEIRDGEDLWQWPQLEIRLNACRRSTIPHTKKNNNSSSIQFNSIAGVMKYNSFLFWSFDLLSLFLWNICMCRCFLSYDFISGSVYVTFYHPKLISLLSKWP